MKTRYRNTMYLLIPQRIRDNAGKIQITEQ